MNQQQATPPTMQLIASALMLGVLIFGVVAWVISLDEGPAASMTISLIMAGIGLLAFIKSLFVPRVVVSLQLQKWKQEGLRPTDQQYFQLYFTRMILTFALLEGGAFANLVGFLLEHHIWSYYIVGWLLFNMLLQFPTTGKIETWIRDQRELAAFEF